MLTPPSTAVIEETEHVTQGFCNYCLHEGNTTRQTVQVFVLLDLHIIEKFGYTSLCVCVHHINTLLKGGVKLAP